MPAATLSLTASQEFTALRSFIVGVLPAGTPVILGQVNRVASPAQADYVVYWPLRQIRLSTNEPLFFDNVITASITGDLMNVTAFAQQESSLEPGLLLTDGTVGVIATNTVIVSQVSGSVGGTGVYLVSGSQVVLSGTLYAGQRADLVPTEWTVQVDVHGPNSSDNARIIEGLFRSEYGVDAIAASGYDVAPLYCGDVRQMPFINAEMQYEDRFTLDLVLQVNPTIGTSQDFADTLTPVVIEVDAIDGGNLVFNFDDLDNSIAGPIIGV